MREPDALEHARDLSHANTMALPCIAERFWCAQDSASVAAALRLANANDWPLTVLGGGSNLLLPARLAGLTLVPELPDITFAPGEGESVVVEVGAGVSWHALVTACVERGLWGIENLALIPGLAGAAPIQNIGAYGVELSDVLLWVEFVDRRDGQCHRLASTACGLGYRDSIFKRELANQVVITRLALRLSRRAHPQLGYGVLAERVSKSPGLEEIFSAICAIRREKLPDPRELPNAGSFFKNPVVSASSAAQLTQRYPELPCYPQPDGRVKLAAGWLIERCGLKGWRQGAFGIHARQALVLVHFGGGDLAELLAFSAAIAERVHATFGVTLVREPRQVHEADS
ncbi:UDP-N-acetylmuramate dehydrogenase [Salinicola endophyticus]|uniref:UDP-N-acetylenolpyruvoylglucosamine reductase n=1 Tax=Salinicola endophyticus TaxID=1949083 RepID=A0ABY8FMM6_9GAMM|nr:MULTISPECIES: UDP-N-acetylmuramate dehydrogenase [Salinicola]WFF43105.1 UDP-N-acetylmuramate dehydrogenase [Salinicola endophyticus]